MVFYRLLLGLLTLSATAKAPEENLISIPGEAHLRISPAYAPVVPEETFKSWTKNHLNGNEIWYVKDQKILESILNHPSLNDSLRQKIISSYQPAILPEQFFQVLEQVPYASHPVVVLPKELVKEIPSKVIHEFFRHAVEDLGIEPRMSMSSSKKSKLEEFILEQSPSSQEGLRRRLVFAGGKWFIPDSPETWEYYPDSVKKTHLLESLSRQVRESHEVQLVLTSKSNLEIVAQQFAGDRDPEMLEATLRDAVKSAKEARVVIPLEQILAPVVRETKDKYSLCQGPNCMNATEAITREDTFVPQSQTQENYLGILYKTHRFVQPGEALRTDDKLNYFYTTEDRIHHAASYIAGDLVFTKGGGSKFAPYSLQVRKDMENRLSTPLPLRLVVLRKTLAGEKAVGDLKAPLPVYEHIPPKKKFALLEKCFKLCCRFFRESRP